MKLLEILKLIREEKEYLELGNFVDQNLYESYSLLGELLNPDDSYEYSGSGGYFVYKDIKDNIFFARLTYHPLDKDPYFEFKTGWIDENGKARYDLPNNVTAQDWDKRSNTVAKIYRDELIPLFLSQNKTNRIEVTPLDIKRYQFAIRLIKKFTPSNLTIIENKPNSIIITK